MPNNVTSITTMAKRCFGLIGTKDVDARTDQFLQDVQRLTRNGDDTSKLTEKQVEWLERIFDRHHGG